MERSESQSAETVLAIVVIVRLLDRACMRAPRMNPVTEASYRRTGMKDVSTSLSSTRDTILTATMNPKQCIMMNVVHRVPVAATVLLTRSRTACEKRCLALGPPRRTQLTCDTHSHSDIRHGDHRTRQ